MTNNHTFFLKVNQDDFSCTQVVVDDEIIWIDDYPKGGSMGLYILAAYTAKLALASMTGASKNQSIPRGKNQQFINSLYYAVSKGNKLPDDHWLRHIFGTTPKDKFLTCDKKGGKCSVRFINTMVQARWDHSNKHLTTVEIEKVINTWNTQESNPKKKKLLPTIYADYGDGQPLQIVANSKSDSLAPGSTISIEIECSHHNNLSTFWIDSANNTYELYPKPDEVLNIDSDIHIEKKGIGFLIHIAKNVRLLIDPPKGTETCIIVEHIESRRQSVEALLNTIKDHLQNSKLGRTAAKPTLRKYSLLTDKIQRQTSNIRISAHTPNIWETKLVARLHGQHKRILFFHIPNL